jgi:hypothetical protein
MKGVWDCAARLPGDAVIPATASTCVRTGIEEGRRTKVFGDLRFGSWDGLWGYPRGVACRANPTGIRAISFIDAISTTETVIGVCIGHVDRLVVRRDRQPFCTLSARGAVPKSRKSGSEYL